jgi:hypothetical protein
MFKLKIDVPVKLSLDVVVHSHFIFSHGTLSLHVE